MNEQIEAIQSEALAHITAARDERSLEDARVAVFGKKGSLTQVSAGIKDVPKEDKAAVGQLLNAARSAITAALEEKQRALRDLADRAALAFNPWDDHAVVRGGLVAHPGDDGRFGPLFNRDTLSPGHRTGTDGCGVRRNAAG